MIHADQRPFPRQGKADAEPAAGLAHILPGLENVAGIAVHHPEVAGGELLHTLWPDRAQSDRCLDGLVADGLVEPLADGYFSLPSTAASDGSSAPGSGHGSR